MPNYKFPLAINTFDQKEKKAMYDVIESGNFTMGKKVNMFEKKFAKIHNTKYSIMVNSGSSANLLMIASLFYTNKKNIKLNKGDEIIVPAISWSTTYYPLYQYGLKLKFVDVDIHTLNYDITKLKKSISSKTRAIMCVNLCGNPNDFNKINNIIKYKSIYLLEDNAESLGATYKGKKTGTFGIMGTFSFFFSHHISTMEGGMILTNNKNLYEILLSLRNHGWTRDLPKKNTITYLKNKNKFQSSYEFILPGYNLRPLEISGALGLTQLNKLNKFIKIRRKNALLFQRLMKNKKEYIIQKEVGKSSWFWFTIILKKSNSKNRNSLVNKLNKNGFETRPIVAGKFINNKVANFFNFSKSDNLINSDIVNDCGFAIGNNPIDMTKAIIELDTIL